MSEQPEFNLGPLTEKELRDLPTQEYKLIAGTTEPSNVKARLRSNPAAELVEWQAVVLRKWEHYLENVLPSGNQVAIAHHESGLLSCIPFLLSRPDLELTVERQDAAYHAGLDRTPKVILPDPRVQTPWAGQPEPNRREEDARPYSAHALDFGKNGEDRR